MSNRIVVCRSVHHGNTMQVANRIATALNASLLEPDDVLAFGNLNGGILGVGSGIYFGRFHRSIRKWVNQLPKNAGRGQRAFLFSTSGLPLLSWCYHRPIRRALQRKGFQVVGEFACRGYDTFGPLWLVGGLNRKHPDESDLNRAESFAKQIASSDQQTSSETIKHVATRTTCR